MLSMHAEGRVAMVVVVVRCRVCAWTMMGGSMKGVEPSLCAALDARESGLWGEFSWIDRQCVGFDSGSGSGSGFGHRAEFVPKRGDRPCPT